MNDAKKVLADGHNDTADRADHDVTEIADDELEQVCGGTSVGPDCTGGGGVHE